MKPVAESVVQKSRTAELLKFFIQSLGLAVALQFYDYILHNMLMDFGERKYFNVKMNRQFSLSKKGGTTGQNSWVHPPEALLRGHIVYNVKFLGHLEVDSPKGTDVVRDAIRKMKFNKQIKKAEGQKPPKVELTISIDGVNVQEPKYKVIQHRYPLHRISYCADDKSDKRMFTFIAKEADSSKHHCFVFDSDKCAEEITLTIGQAFDLAYRRFLDTSNKDLDTKKQFLMLQKKVQQLTDDNLNLKARVADLERLIDPEVLEQFDKTQKKNAPISPPGATKPVVGTRLENLDLDITTPPPANTQTNGLTAQKGALLPPPPIPTRGAQTSPAPAPTSTQQNVDLFGAPPFNPNTASAPQPLASPPQGKVMPQFGGGGSGDPFGMGEFKPSDARELEQQIQSVDRELMDLQAGFSQGLSMGTEDFNLEDLDPLARK